MGKNAQRRRKSRIRPSPEEPRSESLHMEGPTWVSAPREPDVRVRCKHCGHESWVEIEASHVPASAQVVSMGTTCSGCGNTTEIKPRVERLADGSNLYWIDREVIQNHYDVVDHSLAGWVDGPLLEVEHFRSDKWMQTEGKAVRQCIFCGSVPLTREHIIPRWTGAYFNEARQPFDPDHRQFNTVTHQPAHGPSIVEVVDRGPVIDIRDRIVRAVCADCNNGWMSALELGMKRLHGDLRSGKRLTVADIEVLRRWAHKTAVMWNSQMVRDPEFNEDQLAAIRSGAVVPRSMFLITKRRGSGRRDIDVTGFQVGVNIPSHLLEAIDEYLDPRLDLGSVALISLGPLVLISGLANPDVDVLMSDHFERLRPYARVPKPGLHWPGGLRAIDEGQFESLKQLFRGRTPSLFAPDESGMPDVVIHDESRRHSKDRERRHRER